MGDHLRQQNSKLLIRQKGVEKNDAGEMIVSNWQEQAPIPIDELPAPLRRLYTKSVQDPSQTIRRPPTNRKSDSYKRTILNEPLLGGFALLRAAQLLNIDVYYVGLETSKCRQSKGQNCWRSGDDIEALAGRSVSMIRSCSATNDAIDRRDDACYRTVLDDLANYNPLQKHIDRHKSLKVACKLAKIFLSFMAIIIGFNEILSTIVLCLMTIGRKLDTTIDNSNSNNNSSMGLFVLILVQFSSIYILFSTIFNGHLLWNLFGQRQFLISKRFQYKTMLKLLVFIYLEYIINVAFVCNLYDWDFTSNNIESGSYSVLANLRILVTFKDFDHSSVDILMTILAFARGIIRISPYITINYVIICLEEHINTIRNQRLLTDSLKKRQKLRLVVGKTNRRQNERNLAAGLLIGANRAKKRVNFVTEPVNLSAGKRTSLDGGDSNTTSAQRQTLKEVPSSEQVIGPWIIGQPEAEPRSVAQNVSSQENLFAQIALDQKHQANGYQRQQQRALAIEQERRNSKDLFLERIEDFAELESYITNLYIFTGKLNRFMSSQGLTVFFIVHNLVISVSLIVPEAISGGVVMVQLIRLLLILIAILPFIVGQSLSTQLEQLSKQIDRIIIQQHFIHRRRDNLVRIRELIHDIKVNCGGMLNFNVATGIKYLVVAFASAFFIEQEHYKLTRRNKADDSAPTLGWVVGFPVMTGKSAS